MKNRLRYNLEILEKIVKYTMEHPELRFVQILWSLNIINRAWIDMNKWHDYVKSRDRMDTKDNYCFNKENNDRFFDLLCNMKDMENKGIIKFINIIN